MKRAIAEILVGPSRRFVEKEVRSREAGVAWVARMMENKRCEYAYLDDGSYAEWQYVEAQ